MNVLITGGSGYIGGRLALHLKEAGNFNIFLGSRTKNINSQLLKDINYLELNWENEQNLIDACSDKISIVHTAGLNAQDSKNSFLDAYKVNTLNTAKLLNIAIKKGVKRFVYISTAHVYGAQLSGKINEYSPANSIQAYAASHKAAEDIVLNASKAGKIEGIVIRLSNSFGAPISKDVNCWNLLVNDLCFQGVTKKKLIINSSGLQMRDFVSMTNVVSSLRHILGLPSNSLGNGIFNVGSGFSSSVLEVTNNIAEVFFNNFNYKTSIEKKIQIGESPIKEKFFVYDNTKLLETGFIYEDNYELEIINLIQFIMKNFD